MHEHLILYDGTCGLCDNVVQFLLKEDKEEHFMFAPLQGKVAAKYLSNLTPEMDSVILIENYETDPKIEVMSKALFRIFWILGEMWTPMGALSVFPGWVFDWGYKYVARHRYRWFARRCLVPMKAQKHRFLS